MRVVISGGGTAGHVYPGLALAAALQRANNSSEILYVGTKSGLEAALVPQAGYEFVAIEARGLPRSASVKALMTFLSAGKGTLEAARLLRRFKPDVVVGMGAYVSLPVVGAAVLGRMPTVIHEQNAVPGLVNRVLGKMVNAVAVSYPDMEGYFPPNKKVVFTGNPIRKDVLTASRQEAIAAYDLDETKKTLLIFGGSRGAQRINEAVVELYDAWRHSDSLQILHATGKINYEPVTRAIKEIQSPEDSLVYQAFPYIEHMGVAYAGADLLICRSGATTIAEITARGLPAILIPYPYATDNHQEKNARRLERLGASRVILDADVTGKILQETVDALIHDERALDGMSAASKKFGRPDADRALADLVVEVAQ